MKRIKTWKRWTLGEDSVPFPYHSKRTHKDQKQYILRPTPDDRKVMAVCNAAMKWYDSDPAIDQTQCIMALEKACERAQK